MQLVLPLVIFLLIFMVESGYAQHKMNVRLMDYVDSNNVKIWEALVLYETALDNQDELSLEYGFDSVTSASFGGVSTSSAESGVSNYQPTDEDEDDEEEAGQTGFGSGDETKVRHSGSVAYKHYFNHDVYGTSSLQFSTKSDYTSATLGQTISFPFPNRDTIIGLGAYYTGNQNNPEETTTNAFLLPDQDNTNSDQVTAILSIEHLINQKSKIKFLTEHFIQRGYLSTGYQFVPIDNGTPSDEALESLPDSRTGTALSLIYSRWVFDASAIHWRLRLYNDDYGINANSTDISFITYLKEDLIFDVKYRLYQQSRADFWSSSFNTIPDGYFTDHPALRDFTAHQISLGLSKELSNGHIIKGSFDHYVTDTEFVYDTISVGYEFEF